jgi:uracil-DNA glycosylase family protein
MPRVVEPGSAAPFIPATGGLRALRAAAAGCRGCPLWRTGTQTVFGEGRRDARLVIVGEQPGDQEDKAGRPFVGGSGRLLDEGLKAAGIAREDAYVTNAVKHFKWVARGARRLHSKPGAREVEACLPWLERELELIRPRLVLCLGATAARAILGRAFSLTRQRGTLIERPDGPSVVATFHTSSILRQPGPEQRRDAMKRFVDDLAVVARALADA